MRTHTLDGKPRKNRRYKPYKNSRFASHKDMLLFILMDLRDAPKQVLLGELFGPPQPLANKWIHFLLPILNQALAKLEELPSRETDPAPNAYMLNMQLVVSKDTASSKINSGIGKKGSVI